MRYLFTTCVAQVRGIKNCINLQQLTNLVLNVAIAMQLQQMYFKCVNMVSYGQIMRINQ